MRTFGSSAAALILSAICLAGASAEDEKSSYRGAILVKNGQQTSCEVALINNKSGFVAANCLDYEGQTQISKTTVHEVYMSSYRDEPPARYRITKYHLSQQYDSSTPANNLAVVRFNDGAIIEWTNPIAVNQEGWKGVQYVRRAMADVGKMKWAETQTDTSSDLTVDSSCKRYSRIYEANANAFWCSNSTALSVYARNCTISYSLLYAKISSTTYALAGLHSHSVASGANICRDKPQLAYFILLENYLTFAGSVTGMRLDYISGNSSYVPKDDVGYRMKKASGDKPSGLSQFTGNLYAYEGVDLSRIPVDPSSAASGSSSLTPPTTAGSSISKPSYGVYNSGLSKTMTIVIATVVPIVAIAAIVALFFLYKWHKKRKHDREWDPLAERSNYYAQNIARDFNRDSGPPTPASQTSPMPSGSRNLIDLHRTTHLFVSNTPRESQPPPPYVEPDLRNSVLAQPSSPRTSHAPASPRTYTLNALDGKRA